MTENSPNQSKPRIALSIRILLVSSSVLVIALLMAVTTYIDIERQRSNERNELEERGSLLARTLNSVLPNPLRAGDRERLNDFAAAIWAQPDVSHVGIFDSDGGLLVGPGPNQFPRDVRYPDVIEMVSSLHPQSVWTPEGLEVTAPVTAGATPIGAVQFGFTTDRIDDEISDLTVGRLWQTASLMIVGAFFAYLFSTYLTDPIRRLVTATRRLAAGNLSARVQIKRGSEMTELGNAFNEMASELKDKVEALEESRTRIVHAQEDVRREIATHLHGPVQGRLLALRAELQRTARNPDLEPSVRTSLMGIVGNMGQVIQEEISSLSRRLYPAIVRRGVVPSIQSLGDAYESALEVKLSVDEELAARERLNPDTIPEATKLAVYRIAEEAFSNIAKHAAAAKVDATVDLSGGFLTLRITDDGAGFEADEDSAGLGLRVMLDYAEAAGGTCRIESKPGAGTTVVAVMPVGPEGPQA